MMLPVGSAIWRRLWSVVPLLGMVLGNGCTPADLVAPNGSSITVSADRATVAAGSDSVSIVVAVSRPGGLQAEDGTNVLVSTTLGSLRGDPGQPRAGLVRLTTTDGLATAWFHPGDAGGTATVTARSGAASGTSALTVADAVAPDGATVVWGSRPDTVAQGSGIDLIAFLRTKEQAAVGNGTRVAVRTTAGAATPAVLLTRAGFASFRYTAPRVAGPVWIGVTSGTLSDSISLVIR